MRKYKIERKITMVEEKSLKITGANKTFFAKLSTTLNKILIPTKVGINGLLISSKRNNLIKAYERYTSEDYEADEKETFEKKYEEAYTAYLETLDKYVMDSIYKKVKNNLMNGIVQNMEGAESDKHIVQAQNLSDNKRLLEESKEKIDEIEDRLMELPNQIKAINDKLMIDTMTFCYERLRTNKSEADEISQWIAETRVELKKNLIRKQNREINNREIYTYMNDIFGKDVMNLFDVNYEDYEQNLRAAEEAAKKAKEKALEKQRQEEEKAKELENIKAD